MIKHIEPIRNRSSGKDFEERYWMALIRQVLQMVILQRY
jgi:hypothetical protein